MFNASDYAIRGMNYLHNHAFPSRKRVSSLMIYATDLCDSGCKHCLIWAKRPPMHLSVDDIIRIMQSRCIHSSTAVGLEGGEFLLHPEADQIMEWFARHHPNFDLFSNCLKPDRLIAAAEKYKPRRLYISLDGDQSTYLYMRGKDGYRKVLQVIESLKNKLPVFVMFTLSPYNDLADLEHVAELCKQYGVNLRVGIYNNIPFFDTIEKAGTVAFGQLKNTEILTFSQAKERQQRLQEPEVAKPGRDDYVTQIPRIVRDFEENYDYLRLYKNWHEGQLRLKCFSILDSVIILPDGAVPICQNLPLKLGNIHEHSLDDIFNGPETIKTQKHYSENCNQCWVNYHRKYDIILYRNFEKFFGRWATTKLLGYYKWDADDRKTYSQVMND